MYHAAPQSTNRPGARQWRQGVFSA